MSSGQIKYTNSLSPGAGWTTLNPDNSRILFYDNGGSDWSGIGVDASGHWWLRTGTASQNVMVMLETGNVGIGSTNPTQPLDVVGNIASTGTVSATTLTGSLSTAAQPNVTSLGTLGSLTVSGDVTVDTNTLVVDSANNRVGIGSATPTRPLDVAGNVGDIIRVHSTGGEADILYSNATNSDTWQVGCTSTASFFYIFGATYDLAVVRSSGNVGIGTTNPAEKLDVNGNVKIGPATLPSPTGSAPLYAARAFVIFGFDNSTSTIFIQQFKNIAYVNVTSGGSSSDSDFTVGFTTSMPNSDYAVVSGHGYQTGVGVITPRVFGKTTSLFRVWCVDTSGNFRRPDEPVSFAVFN